MYKNVLEDSVQFQERYRKSIQVIQGRIFFLKLQVFQKAQKIKKNKIKTVGNGINMFQQIPEDITLTYPTKPINGTKDLLTKITKKIEQKSIYFN